jgi:hypothetical protein
MTKSDNCSCARRRSRFVPSDSRESKGSAKQPRRKRHRRPDQRENAVDSDPNDAKRQQKQPHDRVENQCQQRQRPAQDKKKTPKQEGNHRNWNTSPENDTKAKRKSSGVEAKSGEKLRPRTETSYPNIVFRSELTRNFASVAC